MTGCWSSESQFSWNGAGYSIPCSHRPLVVQSGVSKPQSSPSHADIDRSIGWCKTILHALRQVSHLHVLRSCHLSTLQSVALAFYEYVLTWRDEQALVWQRKWTASTWLFMVNRYLLLFIAIRNIIPYTQEVSTIVPRYIDQKILQ